MAITFAIQENPGSALTAASHRSLEDLGISSLILGEQLELMQNLEAAARASVRDNTTPIYCTHWAGDTKPVIAANQLAFLDERLSGHLALRIADKTDASLGHEAAWRRTDEYLTVLKRLWSNSKPIDHEGEFYSIQQGYVANKGPQGGLLPIRMSGLTGTAMQVCARHATVFDISYASSAEAAAVVQKLRESAGRFGRTGSIRFALRIPAYNTEQSPDLERKLRAYADIGISEFVFDASSIARLGRGRLAALKLALGGDSAEAPAERPYLHLGRALRQAN